MGNGKGMDVAAGSAGFSRQEVSSPGGRGKGWGTTVYAEIRAFPQVQNF